MHWPHLTRMTKYAVTIAPMRKAVFTVAYEAPAEYQCPEDKGHGEGDGH